MSIDGSVAVALYVLLIAACFALGAAGVYQAVTGNRLSKRDTRSELQLRVTSAVVAVGLFLLASLGVASLF